MTFLNFLIHLPRAATHRDPRKGPRLEIDVQAWSSEVK